MLFAQLKFDKTDFNFGTLENWSQTSAEFYFTNSTNEKVAILKIDASDEVHARYPSNFILPGQTSRILVYYEPMIIGNFQEVIQVYTSASERPISISIRGKVKSVIECPTANNDYVVPSFKQEGQVLDRATMKPVPGASLKFISAQKTTFRLHAGNKGDFSKPLDMGIYTLIIDAPGYNIYAEEIYLNANSSPLLFLLDRPDDILVADNSKPSQIEKVETDNHQITNNEGRDSHPITQNDGKSKRPVVITKETSKQPTPTNKETNNQPVNEHREKKSESVNEHRDKNNQPVAKNKEPKTRTTSQDEETVKPHIPSTIFEGIVLNSNTKKAVNQAGVNLQNIDTRINYFYLTWQDGKFRKQLKAGNYLVNIVAKNYEPYQYTLRIDDYTRPLSFEIDPINVPPDTQLKNTENRNPLYVIQEGMLIDKAGTGPVANASIRFIDKYNVPSLSSTFKSGMFKKELKRGTYTVVIKAKNYKTFTQKLDIRNDSSTIVFAMEKLSPTIEAAPQVELITNNDSALSNVSATPILLLNEGPIIDSVSLYDQIESSNQQAAVNIPIVKVSELDRTVYKANNIVFLIDVSGSMKEGNKMGLLKESMKKLMDILRDIDNVSIITYASKQKLILSGIQGNKKDELITAIDSLKPHGFTYGMEGLQKAFDQSKQGFVDNGNNQVILVTDGMFNSPNFTESQVMSLAKKMKTEGIVISVIGFGKEEEGISTMKKIAKNGGGSYLLIENKESSESVLIQEIMNNSKRKLK